MNNNKYLPIIGLEVHVELKTKSKMFCSCSADYFGKEPNTFTCPVCLGLPGALPVPNTTAVAWCIKIALALNCKINEFSKFDRKNYFYPDLSKGYQISQYDLPFGFDGWLELSNKKKIHIRRVHMEEDTGKLTHREVQGEKASLIDFNRSGVPLVEIVTEPDFHDAADVKEYLQKLQQIVRYLDVSEVDMEKGQMRLEPNISLKLNSTPTKGEDESSLPSYKVEVKNINSFKFVEKAITFELKRQEDLLQNGQTPAQETRGWDENRQKTFSQRSKEDAQDYRYFPEPDIPPILTSVSKLQKLTHEMPELPQIKLHRFIQRFGITAYDAEILTRERAVADYFEEAVGVLNQTSKIESQKNVTIKDIANWIVNKKVDIATILPAELIKRILDAKETVQIDTKELENIIKQVLVEHAKAVEDYKKGKTASLMFLLGQVMKKLAKKVDAQSVKIKIETMLG